MLCAALPAAPAADAAGNYAIWGSGARSCNQFLKATAAGAPATEFRSYLMGYLTALNALGEDTYNALGKMPLDEALRWLGDYCELHKLDSYDRAIRQLVAARHDARQRGPHGRSGGWGRAIQAPPAQVTP